MPKFQRKPVVVEAEQWFPGKKVEGVQTRELEIHYSRDGKFYYVTKGNLSATNWLSVEAFPGPVSDTQKEHASGVFSKSFVQFSPKGEETYHREVLPFSMFEVKQGKSEPLSEDSKFFLDYGCVERWDNSALEPPQKGWFKTKTGEHWDVLPGDWIVREGDSVAVTRDNYFRENYEPVA